MRLALPTAFAALLALAACDVIDSSEPLFAGGPQTPKPGLWALLDDACAVPATADVARWPECATPVRVADGAWNSPQSKTGGPVALSPGDPWVLQVGFPPSPEQGASPGEYVYMYAAVAPQGPAPFARARVWHIPCPVKKSTAEFRVVDGCSARDAQAVTKAARSAPRRDSVDAVWIAP